MERFCGIAKVMNLTIRLYEGIVTGKYELVNSYDIVILSDSNHSAVTKALAIFRLSREVLPVGPAQPPQGNFSNHKLNSFIEYCAKINDNCELADAILADTIMAKEPALYDGMAPITPEIIEHVGLDIP
jgi:hypothetical protein